MSTTVFSGQGKAYIAPRSVAGNPTLFRDLGNLDAKGVSVELKTELFTVMETSSGARGPLARLPQAKDGMVSFGLDIWNADNIALQIFGSNTAVTSGTVTAETLPTVAVGDIIALSKPKASSIVLTDSAGTPATLTENTHYVVEDATWGRIRFLSLGTFTQPFKAAYSYGAVTSVPMLSQNPPERAMRFELINTAAENAKVLVELYRVQFDPVKTLALIQDKGIHVADMSAAVLIDTTKPADQTLGQYGRVVLL